MSTVTASSIALRELIAAKRDQIDAVLAKYHAKDPRLFGSVARGDARVDSDIDILVELDPADGNILFRAGGLNDELRQVLGCEVDVFAPELLKRRVSATALSDAVPL